MYRRSVLLVLALVVISVSANAQSRDLEANIPFAFRVGESQLPAGQYTVSAITPSGALAIKSTDQKSVAMIVSHAVQSTKTLRASRLVFRRYGETYFLSQVWRQGYDQGRQLIPTRTEREMASRAPSDSRTEIATVPLIKR